MGTPEYVQAELWRQIIAQDGRLRGIAAYAECNTAAGRHHNVNLARMGAMAMLRYSANARDVHFLRSLGKDVVVAAAELFDKGVEQCMAVILGQADAPTEASDVLCLREETVPSPCYRKGADRLRLSANGVSMRPTGLYIKHV